MHPSLLASGGSEGSILHWSLDSPTPTPRASVDQAHESNVWCLAYHPLGHILVSASNDYTTRFWCRERPTEVGGEWKTGGEKPSEMAGGDDDDDDYVPGLGFAAQDNEDSYDRQNASSFPTMGANVNAGIPGFGGASDDFIPGFGPAPTRNNAPPPGQDQGYPGDSRRDAVGRGWPAGGNGGGGGGGGGGRGFGGANNMSGGGFRGRGRNGGRWDN